MRNRVRGLQTQDTSATWCEKAHEELMRWTFDSSAGLTALTIRLVNLQP
jgi:hypothetical protein